MDAEWLERVRAANRRSLGMGGMGQSAGAQILKKFTPQAQGGVQVVERPEPSKLPTYMLVGAGVVAAVGALVVAVRWLKEK